MNGIDHFSPALLLLYDASALTFRSSLMLIFYFIHSYTSIKLYTSHSTSSTGSIL